MGISLLGIVAVQVYWFNNSVTVRNELFDRSVNDAMNKAVRRLETGNDLKIIRHFSGIDSSIVKEGFYIPPPPPPPLPEGEELAVVVKRDTVHQVVEVRTSTHQTGRKQRITYHTDSLSGKSNNPVIITEDFFGPANDSIVVMDISGKKLAVSQKLRQLNSLTNKLKVEYRGWAAGKSIDEKLLKKLLRKEFDDRAIPIDFTISINSGEGVVNEADNYPGLIKWYKVNLFPEDIFRKNLELALFFPQRDQFIGRKTTWLMGLSVVFILVIFFTFYWSIYLIVRQKKISEMKSDFINNMTHEFKTPIATISIAADSITNEKVIREEERVRFFAGMIRKENMRMNEQVERILQIARLDRKEYEFNFIPTDVHRLIEDAIEGILLQVEKRGGKIKTCLDASNPVVTTDPVHFSNLVFNLLDNANKYTSRDPEIIVSTENNAGGVIITVEDNGMGMSKAVQSRIFDRFYRLPSGNVHNVKGFGLGLSYVKAILEANCGTIKVWSEPGKGSRFTVFIPFPINQA